MNSIRKFVKCEVELNFLMDNKVFIPDFKLLYTVYKRKSEIEACETRRVLLTDCLELNTKLLRKLLKI